MITQRSHLPPTLVKLVLWQDLGSLLFVLHLNRSEELHPIFDLDFLFILRYSPSFVGQATGCRIHRHAEGPSWSSKILEASKPY